MTIALATQPELSDAALLEHTEDGLTRSMLLWAPGPGRRIPSAPDAAACTNLAGEPA